MNILVTGSAGFIGSALTQELLRLGHSVVGIDNINDYYDVNLKLARLKNLTEQPGYTDVRGDIQDRDMLDALFQKYRPERIIHLAAQAGVRYSLENPAAYVDSNVTGTLNILECCRKYPVEHLVYASTSSVYGLNAKMPFSVHDSIGHPVSVYASTKKANELMAHNYSHLFKIPTTGLRFFTVYGPWGRPDMALFTFTRKILQGEPIDVFNYGKHTRDFTYIDDIVEGVVRIMDTIPSANGDWNGCVPDPASSPEAPYRLYNIGSNNPTPLARYIEVLEECLGRTAEKNFLPMQLGDVLDTHADVSDLIADTGYQPNTPIEVGVANFVQWYRNYYRV